jgi:hypothetical protein
MKGLSQLQVENKKRILSNISKDLDHDATVLLTPPSRLKSKTPPTPKDQHTNHDQHLDPNGSYCGTLSELTLTRSWTATAIGITTPRKLLTGKGGAKLATTPSARK